MNDNNARELAAAAVRTLGRSERGRQTLADFKSLLNNGGDGLDDENWKALTVLCQLCAQGKWGAIEEQLVQRTAKPKSL